MYSLIDLLELVTLLGIMWPNPIMVRTSIADLQGL
jgi:hypothetical protein